MSCRILALSAVSVLLVPALAGCSVVSQVAPDVPVRVSGSEVFYSGSLAQGEYANTVKSLEWPDDVVAPEWAQFDSTVEYQKGAAEIDALMAWNCA